MNTKESPSHEAPIEIGISVPMEGHTRASIRNLVLTVHAYGSLLSKACGEEFYAPDDMLSDMDNGIEIGCKEQLLAYLKKEASELKGITFTDEEIIFQFPKEHHWEILAEAINKNAISHKRISAKRVDDTNEKFAFRVWLTRLGINGPSFKAERQMMYKNLTGHTAFKDDVARMRWEENRRRARCN